MTKPLSFGKLLAILRDTFERLPEHRQGANTHYTLCDAALSAFSVFFMQSPSFLAYQRDMQRRKGCNNATGLFGVERIPCDPQIRNLLDPISPKHLRTPFWQILDQSMKNKDINDTYDFEKSWLVSLDGVVYFTSKAIHCPQCSVSEHDEITLYAHSALVPALVKPGESKVLVLEPEFITPQDGAEKQDCERNAAQRWIKRNGPRLAKERATILADDLHCNQPFCKLLIRHNLHFILTCKRSSHKALYEEVDLLDKIDGVTTVVERVWTGKEYRLWTYRFATYVPLRRGPDALKVNWCELTIASEATGEVLFHNAFATDHIVNELTVQNIVLGGRTRWKVENEGFNVLTNQGYHLKHNYGHGKEHLSSVLMTLILLAFLYHTVLHLGDTAYQRLRAELGARRTFFNDLRALTRYMCFQSWDQLIRFMISGLDMAPD